MSETSARPPLPGLPPLDPVPWTGTAAPGNTGRPYGEIPELPPTWGAPATVTGSPFAPPSSAPDAPGPRGPSRTGSGTGPRPTASSDVDSAQRAGRRALRIAIIGGALGLFGFALASTSPQLGGFALIMAVVASLAAFVTGIGAIRRARRTGVSSLPGSLATALGAVGLCFVLLMGVVVVAFRSEISTYVTCVERDSGSKAATQACTQSFVNSVQGRIGGNG